MYVGMYVRANMASLHGGVMGGRPMQRPMRAQSQGMLSLVNFQIPFPEHTPYRRGKLCAVPTCKRMHLFVVRTWSGSLLGWSGTGLTTRREPLYKGMTLEAALGLGFRVQGGVCHIVPARGTLRHTLCWKECPRGECETHAPRSQGLGSVTTIRRSISPKPRGPHTLNLFTEGYVGVI